MVGNRLKFDKNRKHFLSGKALLLSIVISGMFTLSCTKTAKEVKETLNPPALGSVEMLQFQQNLKKRTFTYFWEVIDSVNYQTNDRYPQKTFTSIAATGFALATYCIGAENEYVSREQAAERVLAVLSWLDKAKQGPDEKGVSGYKGLFYHFLTFGDGVRFKNVELSTIDTGLLMAGVLTVQSYFDGNSKTEQQIREIAERLYRNVQWNWAMNGNKTMSMGWHPETGFIEAQWKGYNEAMILLILALGSPTHPIPDNSWAEFTKTYDWSNFMGYEHINFGPLFGHQYSQMFIDFKDIQDAYTKEKGLDYVENSRLATLSNREYSIRNEHGFVGYSTYVWGLTASDGPENITKNVGNKTIQFKTYNARGVANGYWEDDGTIVPTAAGGSIPFAPEETLQSLWMMKELYGEKLYQKYGFLDAFNLTYSEEGWFNPDYIGIDQGPIIIQLENYESGLIWNTLKKNPHIIRGLKKAGFTGGWLTNAK